MEKGYADQAKKIEIIMPWKPVFLLAFSQALGLAGRTRVDHPLAESIAVPGQAATLLGLEDNIETLTRNSGVAGKRLAVKSG